MINNGTVVKGLHRNNGIERGSGEGVPQTGVWSGFRNRQGEDGLFASNPEGRMWPVGPVANGPNARARKIAEIVSDIQYGKIMGNPIDRLLKVIENERNPVVLELAVVGIAVAGKSGSGNGQEALEKVVAMLPELMKGIAGNTEWKASIDGNLEKAAIDFEARLTGLALGYGALKLPELNATFEKMHAQLR